MTASIIFLTLGVLIELQDSIAELPLEGPIGWLVIGLFGVAIPVGPWVSLKGVRLFQQGYAMATNEPVGAGSAHHETGVVEVSGTAASLGETIRGKYSDKPALAQKYHRAVKEEDTDDDGTTSTSWRTTSRGSDAVPFRVEDETGAVAVDPAGSSLSISESNVYSTRSDEKTYEGLIEPGDPVYVYGQLQEAADPADAPGKRRTYIGDGEDVSEFVVSDVGELRTAVRYFVDGVLVVFLGVALAVGGVVLFSIAIENAFGIPTAFWLAGLV